MSRLMMLRFLPILDDLMPVNNLVQDPIFNWSTKARPFDVIWNRKVPHDSLSRWLMSPLNTVNCRLQRGQ